MNLTQLLKEIYLNNDCGCGCGGCKMVPTLTESNTNISENLQYHINNGIILSENEFRIGSKAYMQLFTEARKLYKEGKLQVGSLDKALLETNLGEFGLYEGENVPLDLPMVNEFNIGDEVKIGIKLFDKKDGDVYKIIGISPSRIELTPQTYSPSETLIFPNQFGKNTKIEDIWKHFEIYTDYDETIDEAEYQGKDVSLNKPKRGGSKAYYVYVKDGDKVKKVSFGSGGLRAKIKNKDARNAFAKRHKCDQKKDRTTAGYWSCNLPRYAKALGLGNNMNTFW